VSERVLFPSALKEVIAILNSKLGPPVVGRSPEEGTTTYLRVRRTGGTQINMIEETAQITIDVYAPDDNQAEDLAQTTRSYAKDLAGTHYTGFDCKKYTEYSGPREAPDLEAPTLSRWRFTFAIHLKGTAIQ
jgi:metal-dependent amidase/aminoacylase/carboxypeptidase family protein